ITYKAFKKDSKGLRIQKEGYYNSPELRLIEQGEVNKMIAPNKNVQIHIKNENPSDDNDSIYVYIETPNYMQFGLKEKNIDTTLLLSFVYDFSQKIAWRTIKNGDTIGYVTSLNCAPLDTCLYKIYY